jgi:AcrR family transcriptional regulator
MRPPLRQRKKDQTRAAIVANAARIFRKKGFEATTLLEIAEATNIHKQTVLRYFGSKEEIAFARRIAIFEQFEADLATYEGSALSFWRAYVEETASAPDVGRTLKHWYDFIDTDDRLLAFQLRLDERFRTAMMRAISREAGLDPDQDVFAAALAALLVSGNVNVARMVVRNGDLEDLKPQLLQVVDIAAQLQRPDAPAAKSA